VKSSIGPRDGGGFFIDNIIIGSLGIISLLLARLILDIIKGIERIVCRYTICLRSLLY
jgi:hypothetical protein